MTGRPRAKGTAAAAETVPDADLPAPIRRDDGTTLEAFEDGSHVLHLPGGGDLVLPAELDPATVTYLDVPGPDKWVPEVQAPAVELGPADVPAHLAFARVMSEVGAIPKTHTHDAPGARFMFRGIEDVQAALYPILVRHGSFILPEQVLERRDLPVRSTNDGKPVQAVALHYRFRFYGPRGDSLAFEAWGEGNDRGDKGTGKAASMAAKTALLQAFMIPTEDQPDADRVDPEERPLTPEQEQARADALRRATDAVTKAETEQQLVAIGGEAARQGLLRLTIEVDGRTMTLQQYGERRLGELKAPPQQAAQPAEGAQDGPGDEPPGYSAGPAENGYGGDG